MGEDVYSFWWNPVVEFGLTDTLLYSSGAAVELGTGQGGSPALNYTRYDFPGVGGSSGSAVIGAGPSHNRRAVGVSSTGDENSRTAADTRYVVGRRDDTQNAVVDVVEEDFLATAIRLPFQRLRVGSPLERAWWRLAPGSRARIGTTSVVMFGSDAAAAWHSVAKFAGGRRYRVSLVARQAVRPGLPTIPDSAITVTLRSELPEGEGSWRVRPSTAGWRRHTGTITVPPGADFRPVLAAVGPGIFEVEELTIGADDHVHRFDTYAERATWEYSEDSLVTPRSTRGSFAGVVVGPNHGGAWGLRNRHLGLAPGKRSRRVPRRQAARQPRRRSPPAVGGPRRPVRVRALVCLARLDAAVEVSVDATTGDLAAAALAFAASGDVTYELHDLRVSEA